MVLLRQQNAQGLILLKSECPVELLSTAEMNKRLILPVAAVCLSFCSFIPGFFYLAHSIPIPREHASGAEVLQGQWYEYVNSRIYLAQEAPQL